MLVIQDFLFATVFPTVIGFTTASPVAASLDVLQESGVVITSEDGSHMTQEG